MKAIEFKSFVRNHNGFVKRHIFDINEVIDFKEFDFSGIDSLVFDECEFKQGITFQNFNNSKLGLDFKNCKIGNGKVIHISDSNLRYLIVNNCEVFQIDIRKLEIEFGIYLSSLKDNQLLRISKVKSPSLDINCNSEGLKELILNNKEIEETNIVAGNKVDALRINGVCKLSCNGNFGKVIVNSSDFELIEFSSRIENNEDIETKIDEFDVFSETFSGALIFNEISIENLRFYSVLSQSGVFSCNSSIITNASFYSTSLKNVFWNSVQFKEILEINNSDFSGLKYANIGWLPRTKFTCIELQNDKWIYSKLERQEVLDTLENLINDREVYRQLKAAATSNQNNIDALEFYRLEMRLYWKEVRLTKKIDRKDRWLVLVNRMVSDFGQNWLLPLIWLFVIHYLLFMSIFEWNYIFDWKYFKNGLGAFFELLNPVHKTPEYINTGMGLFTEFWMRLLSGFFIFHFVRATRKYGKI